MFPEISPTDDNIWYFENRDQTKTKRLPKPRKTNIWRWSGPLIKMPSIYHLMLDSYPNTTPLIHAEAGVIWENIFLFNTIIYLYKYLTQNSCPGIQRPGLLSQSDVVGNDAENRHNGDPVSAGSGWFEGHSPRMVCSTCCSELTTSSLFCFLLLLHSGVVWSMIGIGSDALTKD